MDRYIVRQCSVSAQLSSCSYTMAGQARTGRRAGTGGKGTALEYSHHGTGVLTALEYSRHWSTHGTGVLTVRHWCSHGTGVLTVLEYSRHWSTHSTAHARDVRTTDTAPSTACAKGRTGGTAAPSTLQRCNPADVALQRCKPAQRSGTRQSSLLWRLAWPPDAALVAYGIIACRICAHCASHAAWCVLHAVRRTSADAWTSALASLWTAAKTNKPATNRCMQRCNSLCCNQQPPVQHELRHAASPPSGPNSCRNATCLNATCRNATCRNATCRKATCPLRGPAAPRAQQATALVRHDRPLPQAIDGLYIGCAIYRLGYIWAGLYMGWAIYRLGYK